MAKFRFRLATLQRLREIRRDELRAKLAEAIKAAQMLSEQIHQVSNELVELQEVQRVAASGNANVNTLMETQRYQSVLMTQRSTMQDQTKILAEEIERRRLAVVEADKEVRVLEKLHERQLEEHQKALQLAEVKEMDEVASSRQEVNDSWLQ